MSAVLGAHRAVAEGKEMREYNQSIAILQHHMSPAYASQRLHQERVLFIGTPSVTLTLDKRCSSMSMVENIE